MERKDIPLIIMLITAAMLVWTVAYTALYVAVGAVLPQAVDDLLVHVMATNGVVAVGVAVLSSAARISGSVRVRAAR
jgi:hypothetical protein